MVRDSVRAGPAVRDRVESYGIIGTQRDAGFDRMVFTAAQMFRVPIAIIALDDDDRFWFKAAVGLDLREIPRSFALCTAMSDDSVLVVEDTKGDQRFAENPLVLGPPNIRFYAGAPLRTPDGLRVGSLCVIDRAPRTLLSRQVTQLGQLAAGVVALLESRRPPG